LRERLRRQPRSARIQRQRSMLQYRAASQPERGLLFGRFRAGEAGAAAFFRFVHALQAPDRHSGNITHAKDSFTGYSLSVVIFAIWYGAFLRWKDSSLSNQNPYGEKF